MIYNQPTYASGYIMLNRWIFYVQGVRCGPPSSPAQGKIILATGYSYGDRVDYECDTGYNLSGNSSAHCAVNGRWTQLPLCHGL